MYTTSELDYRIWMSLIAAKQSQFAKAREMAMRVAWDDLPRNEQQRYLTWALDGVKAEELKQ